MRTENPTAKRSWKRFSVAVVAWCLAAAALWPVVGRVRRVAWYLDYIEKRRLETVVMTRLVRTPLSDGQPVRVGNLVILLDPAALQCFGRMDRELSTLFRIGLPDCGLTTVVYDPPLQEDYDFDHIIRALQSELLPWYRVATLSETAFRDYKRRLLTKACFNACDPVVYDGDNMRAILEGRIWTDAITYVAVIEFPDGDFEALRFRFSADTPTEVAYDALAFYLSQTFSPSAYLGQASVAAAASTVSVESVAAERSLPPCAWESDRMDLR